MLDVYQVCHCVSCYVKEWELFLSTTGVESQWTILLGYFTISTNVRCYDCVVYNNFVFQQDSAPVHLAVNTVQLLQCKTLNFLSLLS